MRTTVCLVICCVAWGFSPSSIFAREPPEPPSDGPRWHAGYPPQPSDIAKRRFIGADLPEARHVVPDDSDSDDVPTFVIVLESNGNLTFDGNTWPWAKPAQTALREALARFTVDLTQRNADGAGRGAFQLLADRRAQWTGCAQLCHEWLRDGGRTNRLRIGVTRWDWPENHERMDARVFAWSGGGGEKATLSVALTLHAGEPADAGPGPHVKIAIGNASFSLHASPWREQALVDAANGVWKDIEEAVADQSGDLGAATITAPGEHSAVPWGHVVAVMDVLLDWGIRDVRFPDQELRILFDEMAVTPPPPARGPEDEGASVLWIVLGALLVIAIPVAVATARSRRRTRTVRGRSGSRSSRVGRSTRRQRRR